MAIRVAINGFGRIGRNVLRAIAESGRKDIEVVGINDLGPVETNAHLLRFDSVHGRFPGTVTVDGDSISVGNGKIKVSAERDPAKLPWKDLGVDIALECTGIFSAKAKASPHLTAGAKRVLVSAPSDGRRCDHRLRRQPRQADQGSSRRLQRLLHHQLPRAGRKSAERHRRHRDRLHDHDPRLYRRPADARHPAQRSLSRPGRGDVDDPDLHRCGQGDRPGAAGTAGQARRRRDPRADPERLGDRSQDRGFAQDRREGNQRGDEARLRSSSSRAFSATPPRPTSRSTSTTIRIPPRSTWTRPRCRTARWCG